jgi:hypothetical protein
MAPLLLILLAGGALFVLAGERSPSTTKTRASFIPKPKPFTIPKGLPLNSAESMLYTLALKSLYGGPDRNPVQNVNQANPTGPVAILEKLNPKLAAGFKQRWTDTPPPHFDDKSDLCAFGPRLDVYRSGIGLIQVDAWGREPCGIPGDPFGALVTAAGFVLPYVPGLGIPASAALAAAVALGKGKSLKEAALAAARSALPPYLQVGFDLGVAVASGEPLDKAAVDAALAYVPGARDAYDKGKAVYDLAKKAKG